MVPLLAEMDSATEDSTEVCENKIVDKISAKSGYYNRNQIGHKSKRVLTTSSV